MDYQLFYAKQCYRDILDTMWCFIYSGTLLIIEPNFGYSNGDCSHQSIFVLRFMLVSAFYIHVHRGTWRYMCNKWQNLFFHCRAKKKKTLFHQIFTSTIFVTEVGRYYQFHIAKRLWKDDRELYHILCMWCTKEKAIEIGIAYIYIYIYLCKYTKLRPPHKRKSDRNSPQDNPRFA